MTLPLLLLALALPPRPAVLAFPTSAALWDAHGHRTIAALAHLRLRPATRARVEQLLRLHPDIDSLAVGVDAASPEGIREALMRASVWPDRIRSDARFYEAGGTPTPTLPGFPDMLRRSDWHYVTRAFSDDDTPPVAMPLPGTPANLAAVLRRLGDSSYTAAERSYWLSWILHVVGDLHQPLHGTSRATRQDPEGDAGGNRFWVRRTASAPDSVRLHGIWDNAFSSVDTARNAPAAALRLSQQAGMTPLSVAPGDLVDSAAALLGAWSDESATLAQHVAYAVGPRENGAPPVMDSVYKAQAGRVATTRIRQAADRLAAMLEAVLGD